jgi:hypothetical protein
VQLVARQPLELVILVRVQAPEPFPFVMEPEGEGARVKAFFSILQYNVEYRTNFVFGIGTWDNVCTKRNGKWVFQSLKVNAWMDRNTVLWVGDSRAATAGPKIAANLSAGYAAQVPAKS